MCVCVHALSRPGTTSGATQASTICDVIELSRCLRGALCRGFLKEKVALSFVFRGTRKRNVKKERQATVPGAPSLQNTSLGGFSQIVLVTTPT